MTLPVANNAISLNAIKTEFGGPASPSLGDYYSGGTYVIAGTKGYPNGVATVIPSAGTIAMNNFHGATKLTLSATASWNGTSYTDTGSYPDAPSAASRFFVYSDGTWSATQDTAGTSTNGNWVSPTTTGIGSYYWVKFTITSTSGSSTQTSWTANTGWLAMSSTQTVAVTAISTGSPRNRTTTYNVQIAKDSLGTSVVSSGTVTLTATI